MKFKLLAFLVFLVNVDTAFSASFDCKKASHPIEHAICKANDVSLADEELASEYRFLIDQCKIGRLGNLRNEQQIWMANLRKEFSVNSSHEWLLEQYEERRKAFAQLLSNCDANALSKAPLIVKALEVKGKDLHFPFVQTHRPSVAKRINDVIFNRMLDSPVPARLDDALTWLNGENLSNHGLNSIEFSTVRNDGRLLIFDFTVEGCGAYCSSSTEQYIFDARNGRHVHPDDLYSEQEKDLMAQRLKNKKIKRARQILAKSKFEKNERDTYKWCLKEWIASEPNLWPIRLDVDGNLHFLAGTCSAHVNRPEDALDNLDEIFSMSELKPHFNAYARSLLLGEGDVRDPVPNFASFNCKANEKHELEALQNPITGVNAISAGAGSQSFHLLLQDDGRLWAWGYNHDGQRGTGGSYHEILTPALVGDDFVQVAAGQSFGAGIRRDASLWTWGDNYQGRLGDGGTKEQHYPVKIGEKYAAVTLNSSSGLALGIDGTLWTWGNERIGANENGQDQYRLTPKALMSDVAHMGYGPRGQILAITKDGVLWVWGDGLSGSSTKPGDPRRMPGLFTRLVGRYADAAFKEDGSLWAWGETLAAMVDVGGHIVPTPMLVGHDFVNISVADVDNHYVVALKSDGGLWATHSRGQTVRLEPVGCDFIDAVVLDGPTVLTLKRDGSLRAWANWQKKPLYKPSEKMFLEAPLALGDGFAKLYQVGGQFGSGSSHAFALKSDRSIWQWYPNKEKEDLLAAPRQILKQVPFIKEAGLPK